MALDAATLALTAAELKATLTDAKIAKRFEPTRDELGLTLRKMCIRDRVRCWPGRASAGSSFPSECSSVTLSSRPSRPRRFAVRLTAPYSDERRQAASELAKGNTNRLRNAK